MEEINNVGAAEFYDDADVELPSEKTAAEIERDWNGEPPATSDNGAADHSGTDSGERTEGPEGEQDISGADDRFVLNYLGQDFEFGRDEIIALAQKGMDYDRIKDRNGKTEELNRLMADLAREQNLSPEQLADRLRAGILSRAEDLPYEKALSKVKKQRSAASAADRDREFTEFFRAHGDVDPESIPREVLEKFNSGMSLETAWTACENERLKRELAQAKSAARGARLTAGSARSVGKAVRRSEIDLDWYDGT